MLLTIYCAIIQKTMSPRKSEEDVILSFVRSSRSQIFFKIGVLKNFAIFTRKPETPTQVFSGEYCKIFKNVFL